MVWRTVITIRHIRQEQDATSTVRDIRSMSISLLLTHYQSTQYAVCDCACERARSCHSLVVSSRYSVADPRSAMPTALLTRTQGDEQHLSCSMQLVSIVKSAVSSGVCVIYNWNMDTNLLCCRKFTCTFVLLILS